MTLLRCWWCDRTTRDESLLVLDRRTGYLKCRDCAEHDRAN